MITPTATETASTPATARRLIVNADDFGFNQAITDGIVEAHQNGIVTSTTLMINMPAAEYAVERYQDCPRLSVGLHVNLTAGRPLSDPADVPSLVNDRGMFVDQMTFFKRGMLGRFRSADLEREMRRQFERIHELGLTPTHADSHHHAASCVQPFFIKLRLMKEFKVTRMRTHRGWYRRDRSVPGTMQRLLRTLRTNVRRCPFRCYYEFQHQYCKWHGIQTPTERYGFKKVVADRTLDFNLDSVSAFLQTMPAGVNELCCHPGFPNEDPLDEPEFRAQRTKELAFLTDPQLQSALDAARVDLISYRDF